MDVLKVLKERVGLDLGYTFLHKTTVGGVNMEIREEVHLKVEEKYNPPSHIVERAWIKDYESLYKESISDREGFWAKVAEELHWFKKWDKVLEWNYPYAKILKKTLSIFLGILGSRLLL